MTKQEKINALNNAMTQSERANGDEFNHFTESAPEELKSIFLESFEVRDVDYNIFSKACDIVSEIYTENPNINNDDAIEEIYTRSYNSASVYTATRLSYLNVWNQGEISQLMHNNDIADIGTACAYWFDERVIEAGNLIINWVNE